MRIDGQIGTNAAHELPLNLEVGFGGLRWPSWAIVERHQFALQIAHTRVDELLSEENRLFDTVDNPSLSSVEHELVHLVACGTEFE